MTTPSINDYRTPELVRLMESAGRVASAAGANRIGTDHVLLAMLLDPIELPQAEQLGGGLTLEQMFTRLAQFARIQAEARATTL